MNLTLVRHSYTRECTLGFLYANPLRLATLEEPWVPDPDGPGGQRRENELHESCVPDGIYTLRPHNSEHFTNVWALVNPVLGVYYQPGEIPKGQRWGRSAILIHSGNTTADIIGCVLVGLRHGRINGETAVLESRDALAQLRTVLGAGLHTLTIRPTAGTQEIAA